jgi:hypothetical protein
LRSQAARQIGVADEGDAVPHHHIARVGEFAVAALLGSQVDDDAARLHALDHAGSNQFGRRLARDEGGGDDDVDVHRLAGKEVHLRLDELGAHLLGVTA